MITEAQRQQYEKDGFVIVPGLFSAEEIAFFQSHFEAMRQQDRENQKLDRNITEDSDPLKRYPRIMQPHRRDEASRQWLLDERLNTCMTELLGLEPLATARPQIRRFFFRREKIVSR